MGFDDVCWDVGDDGLAAKVRSILSSNHVTSYYTFDKGISSAILDTYEQEPRYNGYSLTWHMLYPIYWVYEAGITPRKFDMRIPKLRARIVILEDLSAEEHIDSLDALQTCLSEAKSELERIQEEHYQRLTTNLFQSQSDDAGQPEKRQKTSDSALS